MNPRQRGLINQRKSVQYVLKNVAKYGCSSSILIDKNGKKTFTSDRVHNIGVGRFQDDLFGLFDLMTMPDAEELDCPIYLIQVKSESFSLSKTADLQYSNKIFQFFVPKFVTKEIHIWKKNQQQPNIIKC